MHKLLPGPADSGVPFESCDSSGIPHAPAAALVRQPWHQQQAGSQAHHATTSVSTSKATLEQVADRLQSLTVQLAATAADCTADGNMRQHQAHAQPAASAAAHSWQQHGQLQGCSDQPQHDMAALTTNKQPQLHAHAQGSPALPCGAQMSWHGGDSWQPRSSMGMGNGVGVAGPVAEAFAPAPVRHASSNADLMVRTTVCV